MKKLFTICLIGFAAMAVMAQDLKPFKDEVYGYYGFKDDKGTIIVQPLYEYAGSFMNGMATVYNGGKYGFINASGKLAVPLEYDQANVFSEGLAAVNNGGIYDSVQQKVVGGKWGFIDQNGKKVIPLQYSEAGSFYNGKAKVSKDGEIFYIDKSGKKIE